MNFCQEMDHELCRPRAFLGQEEPQTRQMGLGPNHRPGPPPLLFYVVCTLVQHCSRL